MHSCGDCEQEETIPNTITDTQERSSSQSDRRASNTIIPLVPCRATSDSISVIFTCLHTIIRVSPLFSTNCCSYCKYPLRVWQGYFRQCTRCKITLHEKCFWKVVKCLDRVRVVMSSTDDDSHHNYNVNNLDVECSQDEIISSHNLSFVQFNHVHLFQRQRVLFTPCSLCGSILTPKAVSYVCTGCDYTVHEHCKTKLGEKDRNDEDDESKIDHIETEKKDTFDNLSNEVNTRKGRRGVISSIGRLINWSMYNSDGAPHDGGSQTKQAAGYTGAIRGAITRRVSGLWNLYDAVRSDRNECRGNNNTESIDERGRALELVTSTANHISAHEIEASEDTQDYSKHPCMSTAIRDSIDIMMRVHRRNSTWPGAVLNPFTLRGLYSSQSQCWVHAIKSLSVLTVSDEGLTLWSPPLKDTMSAEMSHDVSAGELRISSAKNNVNYDTPVQSYPLSSSIVDSVATARNMLRYATAVYGVAYREGYFNSLTDVTMLRLVRRDYLAPKDETNNQAVMEILAMPRRAMKYSKWGSRLLEPSYCLISDIATKCIVLAFRGSLSDADMLSDAHVHTHPLPADFERRRREGRSASDLPDNGHSVAHDGMLKMALIALNDVELMTQISSSLNAHPDYTFVVTGHSLGAGLAILFTILVQGHQRQLQTTQKTDSTSDCPVEGDSSQAVLDIPLSRMRTYVFAPPPVVSLPLADDYDNIIASFVAGDDVICRLQMNSIDRLAGDASIRGTLRKSHNNNTNDDEPGDMTEELHIPGVIYFMPDPFNKVNCKLIKLRRTHSLLHQIFLSSTMITSHAPDCYSNGMKVAIDNLVAETEEVKAAPLCTNEADKRSVEE